MGDGDSGCLSAASHVTCLILVGKGSRALFVAGTDADDDTGEVTSFMSTSCESFAVVVVMGEIVSLNALLERGCLNTFPLSSPNLWDRDIAGVLDKIEGEFGADWLIWSGGFGLLVLTALLCEANSTR